MSSCPFCEIILGNTDRIVAETEYAIAIRDGYPLTDSHTLIIPKRHEGSFFSLSSVEQTDLFELLTAQRKEITQLSGTSDFNIGINDGPLAGQTVPHCHIHLIPRRIGDVEEARGGVRWIFPDRADYWSQK